MKKEVQLRLTEYDFKTIAKGVAPFLITHKEINRVEKFKEFWDQVNFGKYSQKK